MKALKKGGVHKFPLIDVPIIMPPIRNVATITGNGTRSPKRFLPHPLKVDCPGIGFHQLNIVAR